MISFMRFLEANKGVFHGHEDYARFCEQGLRPGQCIRVYDYGIHSGEEPRFAVGPEDKLYDQNQKVVLPKDVLNGRKGWGFDSSDLELLPDEIAMNL